jgi:plastocyanin
VVTPIDVATAAAVTVTVTYTGAIPEPIEVNMRSAGRCAEQHTAPVFDQPVQVVGGKLTGALVYIKSGLEGRAFVFPTDPVVINQRGCLYEPRIAALMLGQPLQFHNNDPEAHNVRGRPQTVDAWNFMMSRPQSTRTLYFDEAEIGIRVGCDIHPWMRAYVSILPHPYFGITGTNGVVKLDGLPPGDYVVATWHETLGTREQRVSLSAKGSATVSVSYD